MVKHVYHFFHGYYHKNYHGLYRHAKKLFVFDLGLLGLAIFMLASSLFFFFWKPGLADLVDLTLSLGGNRIKSGDYIHLTANYANRSKQTLTKTTLAIHLPDGFIIDRAKTPESVFSKDSIFNLNDVKPGAKGQAEIYGWLWAEPKKELRLNSYISYTPESFNSPEQKLTSFLVNLPESVLTGTLDVTTSTFPNLRLPFTYKLTNTGEVKIDNINIQHTAPGVLTSADKLEKLSLEPKETKIFTGTILTPNKTGTYPFNLTPVVLINDQAIPQLPADQKITVYFPNLSSEARFVNAPNFAESGMDLPVEISWLNNSDQTFNNLKIKITATAGALDVKATAKANNLKIESGNLIIDSSARTALAGGKPGASDKFTVNLKLLSTLALGQVENAYLEITPAVVAQLSEVPGQNFEPLGNPAKIPLASELKLKAEARYYTPEGDQLGRGPLPPRVGQTTKYWIFVQINNTSNAVNSAKFSTTLPEGVSFTGKQSVTIGPEIKYDAGSKTVAWNYNLIPANSQTGLYFEISATPTAGQAGRNLNLTDALNFTATDDFVNKNFNLTRPGLTNVLGSDDLGSGKGAVVTQ